VFGTAVLPNGFAAPTGIGVEGDANATTGTPTGVMGVTEGTLVTPAMSGVHGVANTGTGVLGESTSGVGVLGETSTGQAGVYGVATATTGTPTGVVGVIENATVNPEMSGVHGVANTGKGILGESTSGVGVLGHATASTGGAIGMLGQSDSSGGLGIWGAATAAGGISILGGAADDGAIPIVARANSPTQSAHLQEWQNSSASALSVIDASGRLGVGTSTPQTTLQVNGGVSVAVKTVTSAYTMTTSDFTILANAAGGALKITLPPPATTSGMLVHVKKVDTTTNVVTVAGAGTDKIEGAASKSLAKKFASYTLIADGASNWYIISNAT
jgi:hypothetical protein